MKASKHFDLPVEAGSANYNGDDLFGAGGNGIWHATFCSQEQAQIAARCINHADKLAEALEAILTDYNRYTTIYPVDMTDDHCAKLHGLMVSANRVVVAYRGAE